jgi:hypothetical protein
VLKTLSDSARSLSGAASAHVLMRDGEVLRLCAESGLLRNFAITSSRILLASAGKPVPAAC